MIEWHSISDGEFPPINKDGLSDYVLIICGERVLPETACYNPDGFDIKYHGTGKRAKWMKNDFTAPTLPPTH